MNETAVNHSASRERRIFYGNLAEAASIKSDSPFVVLVPACNDANLKQVVSAASYLIHAGCAEFCCAGALAEMLHDQLDEMIEKAGRFNVVTTWHTDAECAAEYFLFGAGGQKLTLYALVAGVPELMDAVFRTADAE